MFYRLVCDEFSIEHFDLDKLIINIGTLGLQRFYHNAHCSTSRTHSQNSVSKGLCPVAD